MSASLKKDRFASPLGKARGLGSTKDGAHHWLMERVTAAFLVPLVLWLIWAVVGFALRGAPYAEFTAWIQNPVNATLLITLIVTAFYHGVMGLQVIMEDYISCHALRLIKITAVKILFAVLAIASILSILKVAI